MQFHVPLKTMIVGEIGKFRLNSGTLQPQLAIVRKITIGEFSLRGTAHDATLTRRVELIECLHL